MNRDEKLAELASLIQNYREGELDFELDTEHVRKWLSQFTPDSQDVILFETVHIFKEWFISNAYIDEVIDKIIPYLQKRYGFDSLQSVFDSVAFLGTQKDGKSQQEMLSRFIDRAYLQYGYQVRTQVSDEISCYVYFDDGLFTGSRARKDIADCIVALPKQSNLEVFYVVACESGFQYAKKHVGILADQYEITVRFHRYKIIWNDKQVKWNADNSTWTWLSRYNCLWPSPSTKNCDDVIKYTEKLQNMGGKVEKYLFHREQWANDSGPFTTIKNRNTVEKEFLSCGIRILSKIADNKGMYPLGYNLWPSFGLGTFCAFEMNITNTAPLVLWWGTNRAEGNCLDDWYPLLPRRINSISEVKQSVDETEYWGECNPMDQYNMCPDCGMYFGIENDGGNGFCVDCAWKH